MNKMIYKYDEYDGLEQSVNVLSCRYQRAGHMHVYRANVRIPSYYVREIPRRGLAISLRRIPKYLEAKFFVLANCKSNRYVTHF